MNEKSYSKYKTQETWFHGTTLLGWQDLCKNKVQHDYNKGTELDFGYGFYLTPKSKQAESYIKRMIPYLDTDNEDDKLAVVIEFELNLSCLNADYRHGKFLDYNEEFAEFVVDNRNNPDALRHEFDYIIGVMSDSNPDELLADYHLNKITKSELVQGLMKWTSMEQLSLHSQRICDILVVRKAILIDERRELNVDDYNKK